MLLPPAAVQREGPGEQKARGQACAQLECAVDARHVDRKSGCEVALSNINARGAPCRRDSDVKVDVQHGVLPQTPVSVGFLSFTALLWRIGLSHSRPAGRLEEGCGGKADKQACDAKERTTGEKGTERLKTQD